MNGDSGKASGNQGEEEDENYIPGDPGGTPVHRDDNINQGASSSLRNHVYPNPPII